MHRIRFSSVIMTLCSSVIEINHLRNYNSNWCIRFIHVLMRIESQKIVDQMKILWNMSKNHFIASDSIITRFWFVGMIQQFSDDWIRFSRWDAFWSSTRILKEVVILKNMRKIEKEFFWEKVFYSFNSI